MSNNGEGDGSGSKKSVTSEMEYSRLERILRSDYTIVWIVLATLMVDTILHSALVPILPEYLYENSGKIEKNESIATAKLTNQSDDFSDASTTMCGEHRDTPLLTAENYQLSAFLASKIIAQFLANIAVGPIINRFGCNIPMITGYAVMIAASFVYAFGNSYAILFVARAFQGIGSACVTTGGMALVAERFHDDERRSKMLGFALTGLGLGSLIGPSFGSISYEFGGKTPPFVVLAVLSFLCGLCFISTAAFSKRTEQLENVSSAHLKLLRDPDVVLIALAIICAGIAIPAIEASLPLWMIQTLCSKEWMLGVIFMPGSIGFMVASAIVGWTSNRFGGWVLCLVSFPITAAACVWFPFGRNFLELIGPSTLLGVSNGMLDATVFAIMGSLVHNRFNVSMYGGAYALVDGMYCLSFILGPVLAGFLVPIIGFSGCMYTVAGVSLLGIVPILFLRDAKSSSRVGNGNSRVSSIDEQSMLLHEIP